jgi:hypothetical protein
VSRQVALESHAPGSVSGLSECRTRVQALYQKKRKAATVGRLRLETLGAILSRIETGTPYMLYKDACNSKSNQEESGDDPMATFVRKSFNIRMKKRWPFAIWQAFVCRNLWYQTEGNLDLSIPIR